MAEVEQRFAQQQVEHTEKVATMQYAHETQIKKMKVSGSGSASSQPPGVKLIDFSVFELESDEPKYRMVYGFCRAFGMSSLNEKLDGETILHKMCGYASPPWNIRGMIEAIVQLLVVIGDTKIDINAPCGWPSQRQPRTAVDIICENKSPNGVKPDVLKFLLNANCSVNAVGDGYKPPLFYAAGTANLECCKILSDARADVTVRHNDMNLAPYYSYLIALPSTFHLFSGGKPGCHFYRC
jgi:hypothetical protein